MHLSTIKPMLAAKAGEPFDSADHFFEIKWDGIRCLVFVYAGQVRLQSRGLLDITAQFPELRSLRRLPTGTILDGELVMLDQGRPSLTGIQGRVALQNPDRIAWASQRSPATFMAFDLLYRRGRPLMAQPLRARREALGKLRVEGSFCVPEAIPQHGRRLFQEVAARGLEGIVAKRIDSPYLAGQRSRLWLKIKCASTW